MLSDLTPALREEERLAWQRLIRVLCPKCKQPDKDPDKMWLKLAGITESDL